MIESLKKEENFEIRRTENYKKRRSGLDRKYANEENCGYGKRPIKRLQKGSMKMIIIFVFNFKI